MRADPEQRAVQLAEYIVEQGATVRAAAAAFGCSKSTVHKDVSAKYMPFVYDESKFLTNQKCFIITGGCMAYLTAFFNSSIFKFCFRDSFPELQGGTRELSKIFFDKIPVKKISPEQNECFRKAVTSIQLDYTKEAAASIDTMLFDLYNLTNEERKVIGYIEIK